jgi:hypothetical protein
MVIWSDMLISQGLYPGQQDFDSNINKHECHHLPHACLALAGILPARPKSHQDHLESFQDPTARLHTISSIT